ncbi:MAG: translation initiation factor IF-2 associated domain-containing protein, partial [Natronospirillum sp.]
MAEVTVQQLAENIGTPVDRLLKQMTEAGLVQKSAGDSVSDSEKQALLSYLKSSHGGEGAGEPQKITLKRKVTTQLKAGSGGAKGKTVNIEVRKKRTYMKREAVESNGTPAVAQKREDQVRREEEQRKLEEAQARAVEEKRLAEEAKQKAEEDAKKAAEKSAAEK